ncbi:MAG: cytochrome c oxidase subunit II [Myxococcales bacterium]
MDDHTLLHRVLLLPPQASSISLAVDQLHYFIITTTGVCSVGVALVALYFYVRYRRRSEDQRGTRVNASRLFEAISIGGPTTLFLAWFALGFRGYIQLYTPPPDALDVYVTAKQWMWKFSYPDGPNSIGVLRVPAGRPVRLLMTSRDVIHSFFVPDFRVKQDVLPGLYTQTWFQAVAPGRYEVLCAEFCGTGHSEMRAWVEAMRPADYDRWMGDQKQGIARAHDSGGPLEATERGEGLAEVGRRVAAEAGCFKCHTLDGTAHIGPTWLGLYHRLEPLESGEIVYVDEAYLTKSMMDPMADIVLGYRPVMPTFQGKLSAPQTAAIVELIKSLRSREYQEHPAAPPVYAPIFKR